jgi:integrase
MASFVQLPSGNWRAVVRRKARYVTETFRRKYDADSWALEMERRIDRGQVVARGARPQGLRTLADLIDLHIADMLEVRKPLRRSKAYTLELLRQKLGPTPFDRLTRDMLVNYGRRRGQDGAGPVTVSSELSYLNTIVTHASAVHGIAISKEPIELARVALRRLGLIGKGRERDRRPTQAELDALIAYLDGNPRQVVPVGRIIRFAVATAMRQSEIASIVWPDVDDRIRTILVRDRKDPRNKDGNHQRVPLIALTGYDAWGILQEQRFATTSVNRIFPYDGKSVGTAFRRACRELSIDDLHFHDLRHEATSRLFEAGLSIEKVALVTGHRDWKMLRRYTHLRPEIVFPVAPSGS